MEIAFDDGHNFTIIKIGNSGLFLALIRSLMSNINFRWMRFEPRHSESESTFLPPVSIASEIRFWFKFKVAVFVIAGDVVVGDGKFVAVVVIGGVGVDIAVGRGVAELLIIFSPWCTR